MQSFGARSVRRFAIAVVVTVGWAAAQGDPEVFAKEEAYYRDRMQRPALQRRHDGRIRLAKTRDPRAFTMLTKDYLKPEEPRDFVRSLVVWCLAQEFRAAEFVPTWQQWRKGLSKPEHAWLWCCSLAIESRTDDVAWLEVAGDRSLPIELRGAALKAATMRERRVSFDDATRALVMDLIERPGNRSTDRAIVLEGVADLFAANSEPLDARSRTVLRALVGVMAERATTPRTRIVMARSLARALKRGDIGPDPEGWSELLVDEPTPDTEMAYAARRAAVRQGFFGIPEHGRTIAYVIDASDSMLEPLTPRELDELQPVTGAEAAKKGPGGADAGAQAEQTIDWSKVRNRFDAARELLTVALRRLPADTKFVVVLFGDRAAPLAATPKLVPATPKNVDAVVRELMAITPGKPVQDRPRGTLRGSTNVHSGLASALCIGQAKKFSVPGKRDQDQRARLERAATEFDEQGVDTIYLLSDGAPSWDDFDALDVNEDGQLYDGESKTGQAYDGKQVIVGGPFGWGPLLCDDVRRLNLLQRATIHAIGLGEADYYLLQQLADIQHGTVLRIGKAK